MRTNVKLLRLENRVLAAKAQVEKGVSGGIRKLRQRNNVLSRALANGWENRIINMHRNGQTV